MFNIYLYSYIVCLVTAICDVDGRYGGNPCWRGVRASERKLVREAQSLSPLHWDRRVDATDDDWEPVTPKYNTDVVT